MLSSSVLELGLFRPAEVFESDSSVTSPRCGSCACARAVAVERVVVWAVCLSLGACGVLKTWVSPCAEVSADLLLPVGAGEGDLPYVTIKPESPMCVPRAL